MASAIVAALLAFLSFAFVEGMARVYPPRSTWIRLRSKHGRRAVWAMRRRFEAAVELGFSRRLLTILIALMIIWVAVASLLDKRWQEVVMDLVPYFVIGLALARVPFALRQVVARMKRYEEEAGDDPDRETEPGDGGPAAIAL